MKIEEILLYESVGKCSNHVDCQINGLYTVSVADPNVDENIESDIIPQWLTDEKPFNFLLK